MQMSLFLDILTQCGTVQSLVHPSGIRITGWMIRPDRTCSTSSSASQQPPADRQPPAGKSQHFFTKFVVGFSIKIIYIPMKRPLGQYV